MLLRFNVQAIVFDADYARMVWDFELDKSDTSAYNKKSLRHPARFLCISQLLLYVRAFTICVRATSAWRFQSFAAQRQNSSNRRSSDQS